MDWFQVSHLDVERLLAEWRWLCPGPMTLVARNAFADLFLRDAQGHIFRLDVGLGQLTRVAESETEFRERAKTPDKREEWFAESDEKAAAARGFTPDANESISLSIPIIFKEAGSPDTVYVAEIYDTLSFMGSLHRQVAGLPDGTKVRLKVTE
ncbi:MAG TPA: hypothetical protein VKW06_18870 [Candidatus Angelobacter sp.]|nr:hypothetical protein [Candidatus Angelobacter sp.]